MRAVLLRAALEQSSAADPGSFSFRELARRLGLTTDAPATTFATTQSNDSCWPSKASRFFFF
jgi:hypothetical protein